MGFIENDTARTILSLAVMLTAGFLVTRVTKRLHLPNVTGYILAGILIGPCVFGLIPADMIGRDGIRYRHRACLHRLWRRKIFQMGAAEKERLENPDPDRM